MNRLLAALVVSVVLTACSPRHLIIHSVADSLAGQSLAAEDDLGLAREASAFYLKLSESVLRENPGHLGLAQSVAGGFTQYAYAFVAFEAERLEAKDARAAQRLRARAARLYWRGHRHAMAALERQQPGFAAALSSADTGARLQLPANSVGVAYWAAAAWGAHIALSKDRPDVVADLPVAVRLASLAWQHQPDYGQGDLAVLMGSLEAARPGGNAAQARAYFERAVAAGAGRHAGAFVAQAESLAQPAGDRPRFEALLRQALAISAIHPDLANEVMRERAQWLLDTVDDRF